MKFSFISIDTSTPTIENFESFGQFKEKWMEGIIPSHRMITSDGITVICPVDNDAKISIDDYELEFLGVNAISNYGMFDLDPDQGVNVSLFEVISEKIGLNFYQLAGLKIKLGKADYVDRPEGRYILGSIVNTSGHGHIHKNIENQLGIKSTHSLTAGHLTRRNVDMISDDFHDRTIFIDREKTARNLDDLSSRPIQFNAVMLTNSKFDNGERPYGYDNFCETNMMFSLGDSDLVREMTNIVNNELKSLFYDKSDGSCVYVDASAQGTVNSKDHPIRDGMSSLYLPLGGVRFADCFEVNIKGDASLSNGFYIFKVELGTLKMLGSEDGIIYAKNIFGKLKELEVGNHYNRLDLENVDLKKVNKVSELPLINAKGFDI